MKISKITIKNFRSIEEASIDCLDFNIFVGQNNSGKTNLFEAIEWFYTGKGDMTSIVYRRNTSLEVLVQVEFVNVQHGIKNMKNAANKTKIENIVKEQDTVIVSRSSSDSKKRVLIVGGEEVKPGTGFDAALNDFLPRFEYINTKLYYDSVAKYDKKTPVGIMLSGVLSVILEEDPNYREFQTKFSELFESEESAVRAQFTSLGGEVTVHLKRQFPEATEVRFEVSPPIFDDLLKKFETRVNDGIETYAEEKGDGMQRALMLAIIQAYADFRKKNDDEGRSFSFFIDEAELHLHPLAQRKLKNILLLLSEGNDQVLITTHSSVFVADDHSRQRIFVVEKDSGSTTFKGIGPLEKPYIVYELLGGSPADLLLPHNFLIVEGKSEVTFFSEIIKRFYSDKPEIQIVAADGDIEQTERSINNIEKCYTPLGRSIYSSRVVILCDKPETSKEAGVRDFLSRHKSLDTNKQIFFLPSFALESYYPADSEWFKSEEEVKKITSKQKVNLARLSGFGISKDQLEKQMPLIKEILDKCWANCI